MNGINHTINKEIRKECYKGIRAILKTELYPKNKVIAIRVQIYCFDIIKWMLTEIKKMDTKVRKLITCHRMYHPRGDIKHYHIKRENGKRLIQPELTYKTITIGSKKYLDITDWMLQLVNTHEKQKKKKKFNKKINLLTLSQTERNRHKR